MWKNFPAELLNGRFFMFAYVGDHCHTAKSLDIVSHLFFLNSCFKLLVNDAFLFRTLFYVDKDQLSREFLLACLSSDIAPLLQIDVISQFLLLMMTWDKNDWCCWRTKRCQASKKTLMATHRFLLYSLKKCSIHVPNVWTLSIEYCRLIYE